MKLEERIAQAIDTYNSVINVMSPNVVYLGQAERHELFSGTGIYRQPQFMGLNIVPVALGDYLQVARVECAHEWEVTAVGPCTVDSQDVTRTCKRCGMERHS